MSKSIAEVIREPRGKNLGLSLKPPERPGVDDTVAVALERVAIRVFRLRIAPPEATRHRESKTGQHDCRRYCAGCWFKAPRAASLTGPVWARNGSSSFLASAGLVGAMAFASSIVA